MDEELLLYHSHELLSNIFRNPEEHSCLAISFSKKRMLAVPLPERALIISGSSLPLAPSAGFVHNGSHNYQETCSSWTDFSLSCACGVMDTGPRLLGIATDIVVPSNANLRRNYGRTRICGDATVSCQSPLLALAQKLTLSRHLIGGGLWACPPPAMFHAYIH